MNRLQQRTLLILCLLLLASPLFLFLGRLHFPSPFLDYFRYDRMSRFDGHIRDISAHHGLDPRLVKALIRAESKFNHMAVSPKGAMGLMQLMPGTAKDMGISNPFDPKENIEGGVRYLKWLLRRFDNDMTLALAAYNAGPEVVKRYRGVPPYKETEAYLKKVMKFYSDYREKT